MSVTGQELPSSRTPFSALRLRDYRWYWLSGLGMTGAQNIQRLALAWLILELTDSSGQLGLMIFFMGVPMSLVALWGGVIADRYDRRWILILTQAFTSLNLGALALLAMAGMVETWQVYASSVGLGVMQALTMPARNAIIRSLVGREDLKNAVALNTIQMQTSQVLWPSIAGGVIAWQGVGATLAISAILSLSGIFFLLGVRMGKSEARASGRSPFRDLVEGLRYSFSAPKVSTLMGMAMIVGFLGLPFMSMAPGFARQILHFSAGQTGLMLMATGIGSILGSLFVLMVRVKDNLRLYFVGSGLMGLSVALVALAPFSLLTFLPAAGFGFCLSIMIVGGQTLFQTVVPPELLGRVTSVWSLVAGIGFIASMPIGLLGDAFGLRPVLAVSGFALAAAVLANGGVRTSVLRPRQVSDEAALASA